MLRGLNTSLSVSKSGNNQQVPILPQGSQGEARIYWLPLWAFSRNSLKWSKWKCSQRYYWVPQNNIKARVLALVTAPLMRYKHSRYCTEQHRRERQSDKTASAATGVWNEQTLLNCWLWEHILPNPCLNPAPFLSQTMPAHFSFQKIHLFTNSARVLSRRVNLDW